MKIGLQVGTIVIISKAINRIINAVRYNENPEAPEWKDDEMGTLVSHVLSRDRLGGLTCLKDIYVRDGLLEGAVKIENVIIFFVMCIVRPEIDRMSHLRKVSVSNNS